MLRFLCGLVLILLLSVALGGGMAAIAGVPAHRGVMVDIGGRKLRLVCEGPESARPAVWFEPGAFGQAEDFAVIQSRLTEAGVRSCAYDRAGLGLSDPGPAPRDGLAILSDRDALIAAAGLPGPFVVVAHSFGGLQARLWTASHPGQVAGLVLVDAAQPEGLADKRAQVWVARFGDFSRIAAGTAALGLLKPVGALAGDQVGLPPAEAKVKRWAFGSARHNRWAASEVLATPKTAQQGLAAGPIPPELPVAVVTAGAETGDNRAWKARQAAPALASRSGSVVHVAGAAHASVLGERFADHVVQATLRVLAATSPAKTAGGGGRG